jgi:nucleotide-binding universal stress UspA family protein
MTGVTGAPVVAGVDGSARGLDAAEAAAIEAALHHRPLRIVHVSIWPAAPGSANRDRADEILDEAVQLVRRVRPDVAATSEIVEGRPAAALVDAARTAFLLVLGDRGTGDLADLLVGSVAEQTTTHAASPVMVIRGALARPGPVVVGVDGSRRSHAALDVAAQEASLRSAELVAVHVWGGGSAVDLGEPMPLTERFWTSEEIETRVMAEAVAGIAERYPDVPVRRSIVRGKPRAALTEHSRTAQLMVIGSRGHGGFGGLLLGSVSRHLMHHSMCPTVIVRAG